MPRASLLVTAALTLPLAACAVEDDDELELGTAEQALGCAEWGCNSNSPIVLVKGVGTLSLNKVPNPWGMKPTGEIIKNGQHYLLNVVRDQIVGLDPITKVPTLTGSAVDDAAIPLVDSAVPPTTYYIKIEDVYHTLDYWVDPGRAKVWSYRLTWGFGQGYQSSSEPPRGDICPAWPTTVDWPIPPGNNAKEAIVFIGDRYNAFTKDVTIGAGKDRWFNIACAGSALAKLHMNRHTSAGSDLTHDTDDLERSTMLHMYTGAYCDNGKAYTQLGVGLYWQNSLYWNDNTWGANGEIEAVWGPDGAVCLDRPRLSTPWSVAADLATIAAECGAKMPPPCDAEDWADPEDWADLGYIVSKLP